MSLIILKQTIFLEEKFSPLLTPKQYKEFMKWIEYSYKRGKDSQNHGLTSKEKKEWMN